MKKIIPLFLLFLLAGCITPKALTHQYTMRPEAPVRYIEKYFENFRIQMDRDAYFRALKSNTLTALRAQKLDSLFPQATINLDSVTKNDRGALSVVSSRFLREELEAGRACVTNMKTGKQETQLTKITEFYPRRLVDEAKVKVITYLTPSGEEVCSFFFSYSPL